MPQLSLYLDEPTMEVLRGDASREGVSLSKYVSALLREQQHGKGWPTGWFKVYGALSDEVGFALPDDEPWEEGDIPALEVGNASAG